MSDPLANAKFSVRHVPDTDTRPPGVKLETAELGAGHYEYGFTVGDQFVTVGVVKGGRVLKALANAAAAKSAKTTADS